MAQRKNSHRKLDIPSTKARSSPIKHFTEREKVLKNVGAGKISNTDRQRLKGVGKQIEGKVKENLGKLTNNKMQRFGGKLEQIEGRATEEMAKLRKKSKTI